MALTANHIFKHVVRCMSVIFAGPRSTTERNDDTTTERCRKPIPSMPFNAARNTSEREMIERAFRTPQVESAVSRAPLRNSGCLAKRWNPRSRFSKSINSAADVRDNGFDLSLPSSPRTKGQPSVPHAPSSFEAVYPCQNDNASLRHPCDFGVAGRRHPRSTLTSWAS